MDTLRGTMLFAGPIEDDVDWADVSPAGVFKWLSRLCRLVDEHVAAGPGEAGDPERLRRATHRAIAKLMTLGNEISAAFRERGVRGCAVGEALEATQVMLSPIAPHVAEELWHRLGHDDFVAAASWPSYDPALLVEDTRRIAVQIDGKLRDPLMSLA